MRDLYEAIEQLSLVLSLRVARAAERKGWASKGTPFPICPMPERPMALTVTTLHLPLGATALLTPRPGPEEGGAAWAIDVRRTGRTLPESWSEGLLVQRQGDGFGLYFRGAPLSDDMLAALIDEIGNPDASGMGAWLTKLWGLRFGAIPEDLRERLVREDNIKLLDHMHRGLLTVPSAAEARAFLERSWEEAARITVQPGQWVR